MLPRERVIQVLKRESPDRIPIYGWVKINLEEEISKKFGSVENFEDKYEFDLARVYGKISPYSSEQIKEIQNENNGEIEPGTLLDFPLTDPNDMSKYEEIIEGIRYYKETKGRFVHVQTPGIFE